jgi:hypothetical protein
VGRVILEHVLLQTGRRQFCSCGQGGAGVR